MECACGRVKCMLPLCLLYFWAANIQKLQQIALRASACAMLLVALFHL